MGRYVFMHSDPDIAYWADRKMPLGRVRIEHHDGTEQPGSLIWVYASYDTLAVLDEQIYLTDADLMSRKPGTYDLDFTRGLWGKGARDLGIEVPASEPAESEEAVEALLARIDKMLGAR